MENRARLYANAETRRIGIEIAGGPRRTDAEYTILFEEMLASAFRVGYAAGEDDARFRHSPRTMTPPVPHARRK